MWLTLDETGDYELLNRIYEGVAFDGVLPRRVAIDYVVEKGLGDMNAEVEQFTLDDTVE